MRYDRPLFPPPTKQNLAALETCTLGLRGNRSVDVWSYLSDQYKTSQIIVPNVFTELQRIWGYFITHAFFCQYKNGVCAGRLQLKLRMQSASGFRRIASKWHKPLGFRNHTISWIKMRLPWDFRFFVTFLGVMCYNIDDAVKIKQEMLSTQE